MKNCKIAAILLVMLLLVSSFSAVISAETTGTADFTVGIATAKAGETVSLLVSAANCPDAKSMKVALTYDKNVLELDTANSGWLVDALLKDLKADTGVMAVASATKFNGNVLKLTFKVKEGAADGEYAVKCDFTVKLDETVIPSSSTPGKIVVGNGSAPVEPVDTTLTVGSAAAKAGETVSLKVALAGAPAGKSMKVTLTYDKSVLELDTAKSAWLVNALLKDLNADTGVMAVASAEKFDGDVLDLVFKVKDGAASAVYDVKVDVVIKNDETVAYSGSASGKVTVAGDPASKATATVSSGSVKVGESIELFVKAENFAAAKSMLFTLEYDKAVLEFDAANSAWLVDGLLKDINAAAEKGTIAVASATKFDGNILKLVFKAKADAKAGDTTVKCNLTVKNDDVALVVESVAGTVKVTPAVLRGDVNGDGLVNSADALYLLRHTFAAESYPINQSGDMDGSKTVDSKDALYLLRHSFDKDNYPLS